MCKWSIEEFARNLGIMTKPTLKNIHINLNNYLRTIWDIIGTIYSTSLVCWTGDYLIKGTTWCSWFVNNSYKKNTFILYLLESHYFFLNLLDKRKQYLANKYEYILFVCLMVFNTTFNNISVISWRSV
jgi:hypothetical protein